MAEQQDDTSNQYSTVQGLVRGLAVLHALNRQPDGTGTVIALAAVTHLHRTTVKRLLETLRQTGFVRFVAETNSYRLDFRVQQLSEGFRDDAWISTIARPRMQALTERILWPSNLVTLEGDRLVVRESTHQFSPLSFHTGVLGASIPLLRTAAGRAYLAFTTDDERELLLEMLRERSDAEGRLAADARGVRLLLDGVRAAGYAVNEGDWIGKGRFGGLAVPVRLHGKLMGSLDIVFSKRAIRVQSAAERYACALTETAADIEREADALALTLAVSLAPAPASNVTSR